MDWTACEELEVLEGVLDHPGSAGGVVVKVLLLALLLALALAVFCDEYREHSVVLLVHTMHNALPPHRATV